MNRTTIKVYRLHRVAMFLNLGCFVFFLVSFVGLGIYIGISGDVDARWLVIRYLPAFVVFGIAWIIGCMSSISLWIARGHSRTTIGEQLGAVSLPLSVIFLMSLR